MVIVIKATKKKAEKKKKEKILVAYTVKSFLLH